MAVHGPIPVEFGRVFPHDAYAAGAVEPVRDFDASKGDRFVQAKDRESGLPVGAVDVIDADPQARSKTARVKIAATDQPVLPRSSTRAALLYQHATRERDEAIAAGMGKLLKDARRKGTRPGGSDTPRQASLVKIAR